MYSDVIDLRQFYNHPLGHIAQRMIRRRVRELWPDTRGQIVVGLGYAVPYLRPFMEEAERVLALMPARQGVIHWPGREGGRVALVDEAALPFQDNMIDRLLVVHALEVTESWRGLLRDCWRVLAPGGRLIVVAPSRRGIWARSDRTPFGHGHPYSAVQLQRLLRDHSFVPERVERAVYLPPIRSRFLMRTAPAWERIGRRWFPRFAGVVMVEASKQMYQGVTGKRQPARRPLLVPVPGGAVARNGRQGVGVTPSMSYRA